MTFEFVKWLLFAVFVIEVYRAWREHLEHQNLKKHLGAEKGPKKVFGDIKLLKEILAEIKALRKQMKKEHKTLAGDSQQIKTAQRAEKKREKRILKNLEPTDFDF